MITKNMVLTTARDADFWASDMLEGSEHSTGEHSKLSDWIWNNKPEIGCTLGEHPISEMSNVEMWEMIEE